MKLFISTLLASLCFLFVPNAIANDSIGATGAGGIEFKKTKDISMEKEVLTISQDMVTVEYEFMNTADHSISEKILFPMPYTKFDFGCTPMNTGPLEDFSVWVNGKELPIKLTSRARLENGKDVTALLKTIGLSDEDIVEYRGVSGRCGDVITTDEYNKKLDLLKKNKLVDSKYLNPDQAPIPIWEASYVYFWEQEFPPNEKITVRHQYKPFAGSGRGLFNTMVGSTYSKDMEKTGYCIDQKTFLAAQRLHKHQIEQQEDTEIQVVDYVLTTGANWSGPIKDFSLVLKKKFDGEVISLCFDGHFKRQDDALVSHVRNFVPKKDLSILFISP